MEKEPELSSSLTTRVILTYVGLFALILFGVYALTHLIAVALQPGAQPLSVSATNVLHPTGAPSQRLLFFAPDFLKWLGASSLVALTVTITGLAGASGVGYILSRFKFVGSGVTLDALVTRLLPGSILLLPLLFILFELGLLSAFLGVLVIYAITALPFCVWQMKGYYDVIPFSFEELARIEGATRWQTFRLVMLPLAAPATLMTALFSFIAAWNEYIILAIRFPNVKLFALPPVSGVIFSNLSAKWEFYAAGAFLVALVVILLSIVGSFLVRVRA